MSSTNNQMNELKKIIKDESKQINNNLPIITSEVVTLILVALIAITALSMSIYTYEDNKDKPSNAFTSIDITGSGTGTGSGEVVAVGGTALTLVADAGFQITGTDTNKKIEFLNTGGASSGTPQGPDSSIQFRVDSLNFGGNIGLSFDEGTSTLNSTNIITGGLSASGLTYPRSDGSVGQFLRTDGSGGLSFAAAPSGIGYGASSGLTLTGGTSFSVVAGDGITVNTGVCVKLQTSSNLILDSTGLGLSPIITGVSFQGNPIGVSYGGTGLTSTGGTCQFLYSSNGIEYSNIGLCGGTSIGLNYSSNPGFITINYTGTGGGGGTGVSTINELGDAASNGTSFTNSIMLGQKPLQGSLNNANFNTAVGLSAMYQITSGTSNVVIGYNAGGDITEGTNLTIIGASAGSGITDGNNLIVIGANANNSASSNEITLGDSNIGTLRVGTTVLTSLSDGRDKTNIENTQYGLDFLMRLRPVDYTWQRRNLEPGDANNPKNGKRRSGFIAQELLEAAGEDGNQVLDLVYDVNPERLEARYGNLIPSMVKSIQQLENKVRMLEDRLL